MIFLTFPNFDALVVPTWLLKNPGNGPKRHTGRDQVSSNLLFFQDSPPQANSAPSGMADLILVLEISSFSAACQ
jgi:hypothetical protein